MGFPSRGGVPEGRGGQASAIGGLFLRFFLEIFTVFLYDKKKRQFEQQDDEI